MKKGRIISVEIRFYEELNDFLKKYPPKMPISINFKGNRTVKDLIESFGIPHTEVDLILVNSIPVDFDYKPDDKDRISVYPVFESFNIQGLSPLRTRTLREPSFVLDVHLGTLSRRLRMLGFDSKYRNSCDDPELAEISRTENRILLTCDRQLLMRKTVARGILIKSRSPLEQTVQVLNRMDLWDRISLFTRCLKCNGKLKTVKVDHPDFPAIQTRVPPGVSTWCREYAECCQCHKIYWKGSHWKTMLMQYQKILQLKKTIPNL